MLLPLENGTRVTSEGEDGFGFKTECVPEGVTIQLRTTCVPGDRDKFAKATRDDSSPW
jgi:hypothetical protein